MERQRNITIKTLFITDLDGTLLKSDATLTDASYNIIQSLIDRGHHITIATGRNRDNALRIIKPLKFRLPVITDNGTFVYDEIRKKFLKKSFITTALVNHTIDVARENEVFPLVSTLSSKKVVIYHSQLDNDALKTYYDHRQQYGDSQYIKDSLYKEHINKDVFNVSMLNYYDKLSNVYERLKDIDGATFEFFPSHYFEGYWWLEVSPTDSGKGNAIKVMKKTFGPDKIICFGDNLNDLSMFEQCDCFVATENAVAKIKDMADEVIGHCDDDSVANYIKDYISNS